MRDYLIRAGLGLMFTLAVVFHATGHIAIPFMERLEQIAYDGRLQLTMSGEVDPRVVIVDIDERSLSVEGQWPWGRDKIALLVDQLIDTYFVDLVAFDMLFAEPQASHDVEQITLLAEAAGDNRALEALQPYLGQMDRDIRLAEAIAGRRIVLGYFFHTDPNYSGTVGLLPPPLFGDNGNNAGLYAPVATGFSANIPVLQDVAMSSGYFSNPLVDSDGTYRRAPLLHEYDGQLYESLSLAVARHYLGANVEPGFVESVGNDAPILEYLLLGPSRVPLDENGAVLVPFSGPSPGFPYVAATDVMNGTLEDPDVLAGAIVMIGTSAAGLVDLRPTPVQNVYPGVEIHANVVTGILDEVIKSRPHYTWLAEALLVLILGVLVALLLPVLSPVAATVLTLALIGANLGFNMYLWQQEQLLPLVSSVMLLIFVYVLNMVYGFVVESRTRAQLRGLFGQYVPPELVDEMNKDPGKYTLESKKLELSVLFTDVQSFTKISESLDPDELAAVMNSFLTVLTRVVHKRHGTIDKYMGDAMMAFWGAPIENRNHARDSILAGLEMLQAMQELQVEFREKGWPEISVGIGINTGLMNVGNMGSEFRMAYTVLGDAVNLGSRLEALTRRYGVDMVVSETTAEQAPECLYRTLDWVRVRGRSEPVKILQPVGIIGEVSEDEVTAIESMEQAIGYYRQRQWDDAEQLFRQLETDHTEKLLYQLYLKRIQTYRQNPPDEDWGGVYTFEYGA